MTKVEIENGTVGFAITCGTDVYHESTVDGMTRRVKALLGVTKKSRLGELSKKNLLSEIPKEPEKPIEEPAKEQVDQSTQSSEDVPSDIVPFCEIERISKKDLPKYHIIDALLGYHDMLDGRVVICNGNTKVYTTWEALLNLPEHIDSELLDDLNYAKRNAVTSFCRWLKKNLDKVPSHVRENKNDDAMFRPMLSGVIDTSTNYDGSKLEGSLDG